MHPILWFMCSLFMMTFNGIYNFNEIKLINLFFYGFPFLSYLRYLFLPGVIKVFTYIIFQKFYNFTFHILVFSLPVSTCVVMTECVSGFFLIPGFYLVLFWYFILAPNFYNQLVKFHNLLGFWLEFFWIYSSLRRGTHIFMIVFLSMNIYLCL